MLVPALAEQHAAHKARAVRLAGGITAPPKPLPYAQPPSRLAPIPPPVELSGTRKHQIMVLAAAGQSTERIARRLNLTYGTVYGVLRRAEAEDRRLLICDVCLILFDLGFDTIEIGELIDEPERAVYNLMAWGRERRGRRP